jgi:membrane-associated phospholipid phosphatase
VLVELLKSIDDAAYYSLNHLTQQLKWLANVMRLGDSLGSYLAIGIVILLALVLCLLQTRFRAAQVTLAAFLLGVVIVETVRFLVPAHRPAVAAGSVDAAEMLRSFPANKVFLFTLAASLLLLAARGIVERKTVQAVLTLLVIVLVLWVAMSQLMLGLHFVMDVAAGLFGGLALTLLASRFIPASIPAPSARDGRPFASARAET